jgi:hypothetical protein
VEVYKTLTPSPSPKKGEGNKKNSKPPLTPLLPFWEKGLGDEGIFSFGISPFLFLAGLSANFCS